MSHSKDHSCRTSVGCGVVGCKYHSTENFCTAESIKVGNENALRKAETLCTTFTPKTS